MDGQLPTDHPPVLSQGFRLSSIKDRCSKKNDRPILLRNLRAACDGGVVVVEWLEKNRWVDRLKEKKNKKKTDGDTMGMVKWGVGINKHI